MTMCIIYLRKVGWGRVKNEGIRGEKTPRSLWFLSRRNDCNGAFNGLPLTCPPRSPVDNIHAHDDEYIYFK